MLFRWTLSINLRSHIAELTHEMYSLYRGTTDLHNEATKLQQKKYSDDESSLLSTFLGFSVFSSVSHQRTLQNLVTKYLATEVIQESPLRTKVLGQQEVKKFVQESLIVAEQYASYFNPRACAHGYTNDRDQKTVMKADISVLRWLITV